jgi:WD40 repeat protein
MLPEGGANDGVLQVWDLGTKKLRYKVQADKHGLFCLAFSPDGKLLATGGTAPVIKLWNTTTGVLRHQLEGHSDQVHDLAFSADGKTLASAGRDKLVILWPMELVPK